MFCIVVNLKEEALSGELDLPTMFTETLPDELLKSVNDEINTDVMEQAIKYRLAYDSDTGYCEEMIVDYADYVVEDNELTGECADIIAATARKRFELFSNKLNQLSDKFPTIDDNYEGDIVNFIVKDDEVIIWSK